MNRLNKLTISDVALIILLVFGSVWFLFGSTDARGGKKQLFIYRDGAIIKEVDITTNQAIKLPLRAYPKTLIPAPRYVIKPQTK